MAEQQVKSGGWFKAILTSAFGLFSGACLMYLSPLVDKVIKPGKPVANFAYQAQGLKVSFQNRSTGGAEGWWDFGDGSALEPFMPDQESIAHDYQKAGSYAVKLSLRNILGDENERTVSVPLDMTAAASLPAIESLQAVPLGADGFAPATFRFLSKVKSADLCIWALGDDLTLEVSPTASGNLEHLVTFRKPGTHRVKLLAISGKGKVEQMREVRVLAAPASAAVAVLQVTDEAVPVDKLERVHNIPVAYSGKVLSQNKFTCERDAEPGYHIVKADFRKPPTDKLKNPKLEITADKRKVKFSGDLIKPIAIMPRTNPPPNVVVEVVLVQERHEAPVKRPSEFEIPVTIPGSALLPMPKLPDNWIMKQRNLTLKLLDGGKTAWQGSKLPQNEAVPLQNRPCRLTATEVGNQVKVDIVDVKKPGPPAGN